jgi:hypothetical protein
VNAELFSFLDNKAGQIYNDGNVINYGEVLGTKCYLQAMGTFKEVDKGTRCPKDFNVLIKKGGLVFGGFPVSLSIKGKGYLRCLYIDRDIRIFESPKESTGKWESSGLTVVQVRDALFGNSVELFQGHFDRG